MCVDTVDTGLNYIVYHSTKSLNYNPFRIELKPCINSNYNLFQIKALYQFKLTALQIKSQLNFFQISGTFN